jgi:ABC-type cobalamin/Fe3+-siderophores transport system ATPase subunit
VSDAALSARGLHFGYGALEVVRGVSLEAAPGEVLAIVGPNGSGKSTLLRLLSGALRPWRGAIELFGRPLVAYERRESARMLASVAQENPIAFQFTVLEVVLMGRAPHLGRFHLESRTDLEIARAALERFGLLALAGRYVSEISGGERKRVFLARALAQEPRVALLDEPTAFLDLHHVSEIFERFRELCASRRLALVTTLHDLNAAALWADRVLLLKDGAAVASGTPREVLTQSNLRQVYQADVVVGTNPATGTVSVLPAPGRSPRGGS